MSKVNLSLIHNWSTDSQETMSFTQLLKAKLGNPNLRARTIFEYFETLLFFNVAVGFGPSEFQVPLIVPLEDATGNH